MNRPEVTRLLAEFTHDLTFDDIPPSVIDLARMHTLNIVACALSGRTLDAAGVVLDVHRRSGGTPESTVIGEPTRLPAHVAAAVNAHCAYCTMNDDSYMEGDLHPGHSAIPAALAVSERDGAAGRDYLVAVVAGIEVGSRIGASLCQSQQTHKARAGWHCNLSDAFVAAVAAGKIMDLPVSELVAALGVAATAASGLNEVMNPPPSLVWPWDGGRNTGQGVLAADLARAGMTAGETALEGPQGFIEMFTGGQPGPEAFERALRGLGSEWATGGLLVKTRSASVMMHSAIDAAQRIVIGNGLSTHDIERVVVRTNRWTATRLMHRNVPDFNTSVFSLPFAIALAVCDRDPLSIPSMHTARLGDPRIQAMMDRVDAVADDEIDKVFGFALPAEVEITTTDGRQLHDREVTPLGQYPDRPLDPEVFDRKIRLNAGCGLAPERVTRLIDWVNNDLEAASDMSELGAIVAGVGGLGADKTEEDCEQRA